VNGKRILFQDTAHDAPISNHPVAAVCHSGVPLLKQVFAIMITYIYNQICMRKKIIVLTLPFVIPASGKSGPGCCCYQMYMRNLWLKRNSLL
jgi:hypothetical protein